MLTGGLSPIPAAFRPSADRRSVKTTHIREHSRAQNALEYASGGSALRQVLQRKLPLTSACIRGEALQAGAFDLEYAKRIAEGLDDSYLFIQGPPGSGKTYTGAHLILHLIAQGHRVGVASGSHAAIHTLLTEVEKHAPQGTPFAGLKKYSDEGSRYESERGLIENSNEIADFTDGSYNLVAGTAWLFCREEMDETLDYLLIDEAGQIALADAIAMGTCARNVILLGDPQQLAQVGQAIHPPGAGVSVLEHLLGEDTTIPPERGLFIDQTRRMHPDVCRFISKAIYEDRLESFADCANQRIKAPGRLTGTGIRYVPVVHEGNARESPEETETIADLVEDLLRGQYARVDRTSGPVRPDDVMVVAPYNAQVRCLRERLPDGVRVGTVDKFQGQEAAVCFFSMATSSGEEIPRNLEFLFSRNRLNVAISRTRCLAVLVCSPERRLVTTPPSAPTAFSLQPCRFQDFAPLATVEVRLNNERVLLIDDVITSGGQAEECRRRMLAQGARRVVILALGVTQDTLPHSCPVCGGFLRLVTSGAHGDFIGCSNYYPRGCRYTEPAPSV